MAADIISLQEDLSKMQSFRSGFESHWQELINYILWFRQNITSDGPVGAKKMQYINDSTATQAAMLFTAGFSSKMANESIKWFQCRAWDDYFKDNRNVKLWLDQLEQIYYNTFRRSNFYTADRELNLDWGVFGTSSVYPGPHPRTDVYFRTISLGETFLAANQYGEVDTFYRKFSMTPKQMFQQWGDKISASAKDFFDRNKLTEQIAVCHAVYPRLDREVSKIDNRNLPWASVYFEPDNDQILEEGGYAEFPYCVSRYYAMDGEVYGRGLGMTALPDVKELQDRVRDTTMAGQLRMQPPVILPHDSFAGVPIKRIPGGFTFARVDGPMQEKIGTFPVAGDLGWSEESNEGMRRRIREIFYNDLMSLMMDKQVTLGEFLQVAQEKMQYLGEALGRLQDERYKPLFDRMFAILWERGKIPPPPRELINEDGSLGFRVEFISPLAKAQRLSETQSIIQGLGYLGQALSIKPDVVDILDIDGASRIVLENQGIPSKLMPAPEDIDKLRQARAQAIQAREQEAAMLEAAKTMPALNKGPEPGSPMERLNQAFQQGAGNA